MRNKALEAAVLAEPDAREPLLVYADWLQAKSDPLGEVIALAVAAEREPARARKLKVNATAALEAYVEEHLATQFPKLKHRMLAFKLKGDANGPDGIGNASSASITWRRGLVDGIHTWLWKPDMRAQMFELLNDRHALLLRKLTIRDHVIGDFDFLAHLTALESIDFRWGKIENVSIWDARVSTRDAEALVKAIKANKATPRPNSDYQRYVSHNEASWY